MAGCLLDLFLAQKAELSLSSLERTTGTAEVGAGPNGDLLLRPSPAGSAGQP